SKSKDVKAQLDYGSKWTAEEEEDEDIDGNMEDALHDDNGNNEKEEESNRRRYANGSKDKDKGHGEEDPSKVYCLCRRPYDANKSTICCDYCEEWYHLVCVGMNDAELNSMQDDKYKCPACLELETGRRRDVSDVWERLEQQQQLLLYQNALQSIEQIRKHCLNKELWYSYCAQLGRLEPGCIVDVNMDKLDSQWDLADVHEDIASIKYSTRAKVLSIANTDKHGAHSREAQVQFDNYGFIRPKSKANHTP
ncbi:hypothetical protein RFI_02940, partial [Reticulomyxa filosa]